MLILPYLEYTQLFLKFVGLHYHGLFYQWLICQVFCFDPPTEVEVLIA